MPFSEVFVPFAEAGQLFGLVESQQTMPQKWYRVIQVEPLPEMLFTVALSASAEREIGFEANVAMTMIQWRLKVVTAGAQIVLRSPPAARAWNIGGTVQPYLGTLTETDWATNNGRALTEFFSINVSGLQVDQVQFDNLAATAATEARASGWKFYLEPMTQWLMRNPQNPDGLIEVNLAEVRPWHVHLLENFAGLIPKYVSRASGG